MKSEKVKSKNEMPHLVIGLILVLCAGCNKDKPTAATASATIVIPRNTAAPSPVAAAALKPIQLELKNYDELQQLIASKKGKIVVVDAWSMYCEPCLKEFHGLVELDKKYGPDKVACISLCTNYSGVGKPEDEIKEPLVFLMSQDATFDNVLSTEADTVIYKKLGISSIPAIFVYDRDGKLIKTFDAEPKYTDVEKYLAPLMAK